MKSRSKLRLTSLLLLSLSLAHPALADDQSPAASTAKTPESAPPETATAPEPSQSPDAASAPPSTEAALSEPEGAEGEIQASVEKPDAETTPPITEGETRETKDGKSKHRKTKRKRGPRHVPHIPLRAGAGLFVGAIMPDTAPALGFALRAGMQRARFSFMLEGGLSGAIGGAQSSGAPQSSRATLFYHGYLAPTAELNVAPLFVSLGVPLGVGLWSSTSNSLDASGTVRSETSSTIGVITFVAGLDARVGRHFAVRGRHHITCAVGTKVLFAKQDDAESVIPEQGPLEGSSDRGLGVRFVPTLTVGYDYF